ncbi:MAG TPA: hypothetical protein VIV60_19765 [Polyangiaceae bacterium]
MAEQSSKSGCSLPNQSIPDSSSHSDAHEADGGEHSHDGHSCCGHCHSTPAEGASDDEETDDCGGCSGCSGCSCDESTVEEDTAWLEDHAPAVDTPTPEPIVELVVACVQFVKDALDVELDFTPETLPILDHYLLLARQTLTERPELRELIWRFAGAYFGELVRRRYNGFWHLPSLDVHTWRLQQRQVLLSFNPVGVVAEAIAGAESSEGPTGALRLAHADQERVAERLAVIPPLPEDQYFLLSTRLEVIDTVVEHLRVCMSENDQADIEFDPDDYANDLQPYGAA